MSNFIFTSPQGQKYTVKGPEGATQEQAFNMLQQHLFQGKPDPAPSSMLGNIGTGIKDVGIGLGRAAAGTYASLPDIGPRSPLKDPAQKFAAEPSQSTAQSVGEIAGNTLPYMLAPEVGAGKLALKGAIPAAALAKAYMSHGVMGVVNVAAGYGMGKYTLNRYLPHLVQLAKQHSGQIAGALGRPLEKVGLGAATTAGRSQGARDGEDQ